ncbi:MAG TPA: cell division protein FtsA [Pseudobacteroides sp.]|nr:cell division protein FtsA [Pseudobacteroides sp.]
MGNIIVGMDIGTSKVSTVIGRVSKTGELEVLGHGMEQCNGIKKGIIVDIESTCSSIKSAVRKAEAAAGLKISSAYVSINGIHTSIIKSRGRHAISNENREITSKDVDKVLLAARNIKISDDREIIDIVPQQFIVDGYDEIIDPVGMAGLTLEVDADIITGKITSVQNIVKSMERADLKTDGLIMEALATSQIVLTQDEKEMGVILIDVGGGTTDISIFKNKNLIFNDCITVGGDHITNDVAIGLKIPFSEAEKIKKEFELALSSLIKNDQEVTVMDINENKKKTVKVSEIVEIIEARVFEIFSLCKESLEKSQIKGEFPAGIVLTGGGISYVDGGKELATEVFDLPARVALQKPDGSLKLEEITSAGIVKYVGSHSKGNAYGSDVKNQKQKSHKQEKNLLKRIIKFFA